MKMHLCLFFALCANAELKAKLNRPKRDLKENILKHLSDPVLLSSIADLLLLKIADKNLRYEPKTVSKLPEIIDILLRRKMDKAAIGYVGVLTQ